MRKNADANDKFAHLLDEAQKVYYDNCDEAWEQVRSTLKKPKNWLIGVGVLLLTLIASVTLFWVSEVHAPELPEIEELPQDEVINWDEENLEIPISASGRQENVFTFLLLGTDEGDGNTDTIMVASYDIPNQKVSLMSIPRDTMVNAPWDIKKINSVYSRYGVSGLREHVGKLIGFDPDFYVKIDVRAFVEVIDLLGGVYFDVPRNMDYDDPYQNLHIHLKKGYQHLDGYNSMGLVRWRHNNDYTLGYSDEERMKTQQAFLRAAAEQCLSLKNWNKISGLIDLFYTYVESDLKLGEMLWFAQQASGIGTDNAMIDVNNINTFTMPGNYGAFAWSRTIQSDLSYVTVNTDALLEIINEHFNPYQGNITAARLDIMSINADGSVRSSTGNTADAKATLPPERPTPEGEGNGEEGIEATSGSLTVIEGEEETNEITNDPAGSTGE